MSSLHRSKTHAPSSLANAVRPSVQRRVSPGPVPPLASLATIPALPTVQRKCGDCLEKEREELCVWPRLEVGPVGDRYEREADAMAGRVMAKREADVSGAAPAVRRACSACGSSNDDPKARRAEQADTAKNEEERVRTRHSSAEEGAETIGASHGELTSGGAPLSPIHPRILRGADGPRPLQSPSPSRWRRRRPQSLDRRARLHLPQPYLARRPRERLAELHHGARARPRHAADRAGGDRAARAAGAAAR